MPVPQERDFLGSLNAIRFLFESTCEDKWEVVIETALPALGDSLLMLIIPDPGEILENYLQPRARRTDRKRATRGYGGRQLTRYGQRRWWQRISLPDLDQTVAQRLPGRDVFEGRRAGPLERHVWRGIDILDRGLWYWLVLDAGHNFVVQWASGIMESRFCSSAFGAQFSGSAVNTGSSDSKTCWGPPSEVDATVNKGWLINAFGEIARDQHPFNPDATITLTVNGTYAIGTPGVGADLRARLIVDAAGGHGGTFFGNPTHVEGVGPHAYQASVSASVPLTTRVEFAIIQTGQGATQHDTTSEMTVFAEGA